MRLVTRFLGYVWGMVYPPVKVFLMFLAAFTVYHVLQSPVFIASATGMVCCYIGRAWLGEIEASLAKLEAEAGLVAVQKSKRD
mmetsp:Transcript_11490/g.26590  ORF Transcript_11490/g.26590 Transcript_11490/m.26590 type:complete len:83 (+) Transcript_11490:182-430(+)